MSSLLFSLVAAAFFALLLRFGVCLVKIVLITSLLPLIIIAFIIGGLMYIAIPLAVLAVIFMIASSF